MSGYDWFDLAAIAGAFLLSSAGGAALYWTFDKLLQQRRARQRRQGAK